MTIETTNILFGINTDDESILELFETYLKQACDYDNFYQPQRTNYLENAIEIYKHCKIVSDKYDYFPEANRYHKRFLLKGTTRKIFDDGIDYECYDVKGLYFVGETHFNPITDEKFYWVKIGKAKNLKERMRSYNTHNPMLYRIDYSADYNKEEWYHNKLAEKAIAKCNHSEEWFLVDRKTYLEMCEKGFKFFE